MKTPFENRNDENNNVKREDETSETETIDSILELFEEELADAENDLALLRSMPATERMKDNFQEAYAAASMRKSDLLLSIRLMKDKKRKSEIKTIDSILEKFSEELADAENDLKRLGQFPAKERLRDEYQKAYATVTERISDIKLSMKLLRDRREKLEEEQDD